MDLARAFLDRSRQYLVREYPAKIQRCLDVLPAEALWRRDDASENSIGNLLLHLSGNVRQWIVSGVGGAPDDRRRSVEFDAREGADASALMAGLLATLREADEVLVSLDEHALAAARRIQGRDVNVLDAVYHVVEHFSMQTGQIILLTKRYTPSSTSPCIPARSSCSPSATRRAECSSTRTPAGWRSRATRICS